LTDIVVALLVLGYLWRVVIFKRRQHATTMPPGARE
jgi:hypothetical protein